MKRTIRQSHGKMLVLVALVCVLIFGVFMIGILFSTLLSQHSRSQYDVDALALDTAKKINAGDRVGQMNHLVSRSRELIYMLREDSNECDRQGLAHLSPLCDQLINEAYWSQALVENERKNQMQTISKEVRQVVNNYNKQRGNKSNAFLPWLKTYEPEVVHVDLGYIDGVQSNVKSLYAFEELAEYDRGQGYVENGSELFKSNINARLPEPDNTLDFRFSALPAYVSGTCSPPRIANNETFRPYTRVLRDRKNDNRSFDQIPHAVQVHTTMDVSIDAEDLGRHSISVSSVGVTGGAYSSAE